MKNVIYACILFLAVSAPLRAETLLCLIEPDEVIELGSQVIGVLEEVTVDRGEAVQKGQVVARLVSRVEQQSLEVARFRAKKMAELSSAGAAKGYALRERQRAEMLVEKNFVSKQYLDQAATDASVAAQKLAQAEENRRQAELEVKLAQAQLDLRTIRSPVTGVVMDRYLTPGQRVEQQAIVKIAKVDVLRVEVIVPARLFNQVRPGMRAKVTPELPGASTYTAKVSVVDQVIDAASNSFRVRLELPNPGQKLPAGARCKADINTTDFSDIPVDSLEPAGKPNAPEARKAHPAPTSRLKPAQKKAEASPDEAKNTALDLPGRYDETVAEARKQAQRELRRNQRPATPAKPAEAAARKPAVPSTVAKIAASKPEAPAKPVEVVAKEPEAPAKPAEVAVKEPEAPAKPAEIVAKEPEASAKPVEVAARESETPAKPAEVNAKEPEAPAKPVEVAAKEPESPARIASAPAPAPKPGMLIADTEGGFYSQPELPPSRGHLAAVQENLAALAPKPAVPPAETTKPTQGAESDNEIIQAVQSWARAWSARDAEGYRAAYAADFRAADGQDLDAWIKKRSEKMQLAKFIDVQVFSPKITFEGEGRAKASFRQIYRSDKFNGQMLKTLLFSKVAGRWLIIREE